MGSIGRYIFRATFGAFFIVLVSLTAIFWVTQALRDFDLMTNQQQTFLTFIRITGMLVPVLMMMIAPIALMIAVAFILNRLSADSEIIVMNAAGASPWRLFLPFFLVALTVSVAVVVTTAYLAPQALRQMRDWISAVRADLVTYIVKPGRFTTIEKGLTFHIRERRLSGKFVGIFVDDRRDPAQHVTVLAEEGEILQTGSGTFLLLNKGSVQRREQSQRDPSIVVFDSYAIDLSRFNNAPNIRYSVRERYLWELMSPAEDDELAKSQAGRFRAELHDRLQAPLYPIVFVIVTYAFLGAPRTNRQSRALSLAIAIGAVAGLRMIGFAGIIIGTNVAAALFVPYIVLAAAAGLGLLAISRGMILEPPAMVTRAIAALDDRMARRSGMATATR
jgi:lipopolysaccharide export system permease protein